jgi:hypothetical protein
MLSSGSETDNGVEGSQLSALVPSFVAVVMRFNSV